MRDAERAIPRCAHVTNDAQSVADRSKHEIERDCAGCAGHKTQDRSGTGLRVPDTDKTENDAQEQRDVDTAVETGMGSHGFEESDQVQWVWRPTSTVFSKIGWSWENALEVKTEGGGSLHITLCPEGHWKHRSTRMEASTSSKQKKQQKIWRKMTSKCLLGC